MKKSDILSSAISSTADASAGANDQTKTIDTSDTPEQDGTVTISADLVPGIKEGDIVQMECVLVDDSGVILKPVESRMKMGGAGKDNVKAAGPDNSGAVGEMPPSSKPVF